MNLTSKHVESLEEDDCICDETNECAEEMGILAHTLSRLVKVIS